MSVAFTNIPGSGLVAPLFALEFTSAGTFDDASRLWLIGHKTSAGSATANAPVVCNSQLDANVFFGAGSMLAEMFRVARLNAPTQDIWCLPIAETGVAATWTLTVGTVPTTGGTGWVEIAGEKVAVEMAAGDTASTVATALVAAINGYFNQLTGARLMVTATAASEVVTATCRHKGLIFADLDFYIPPASDGNAFDGVVTYAAGTAGSGSPDTSEALANLADRPADTVISPWSDATNLGYYLATMSDASGRWSYLRQSYGHVWCVATDTTANLTTLGLGRNDRHVTIMGRPASAGLATPGYTWVTAMAAKLHPWLCDTTTGKIAVSHKGVKPEGIAAPRDVSKWPDYATRNALLQSGISTWTVASDGAVVVDKIVTTYQTDASDTPDITFRDVQSVYQCALIGKYFRSKLSFEYFGRSIADENPGRLQAVATPADIKASMIHIHKDLINRGVVEGADAFAEALIVERNADNPDRVDTGMSIDLVNPLDILAMNAKIMAQAA